MTARERLMALRHALSPVMLLIFEAEGAMPFDRPKFMDGLMTLRLRLTSAQGWLEAREAELGGDE